MPSEINEKTVLFISCGIFKEEIEYLIKSKGLKWNMVFLDAALHVNFDKLKAELVRALEEHQGDKKELKVLYGHCHPDIMEILDNYGAKKLQAGNCLEAMVGREEVNRLNEEGKAFFLSAGWVENWENMFKLGKEDFDFDFTTMFKNYERIVVFDTGVIPIDNEKINAFSEFTKLPVVRKNISLDHLQSLIDNI
jgi:hypothetical protein